MWQAKAKPGLRTQTSQRAPSDAEDFSNTDLSIVTSNRPSADDDPRPTMASPSKACPFPSEAATHTFARATGLPDGSRTRPASEKVPWPWAAAETCESSLRPERWAASNAATAPPIKTSTVRGQPTRGPVERIPASRPMRLTSEPPVTANPSDPEVCRSSASAVKARAYFKVPPQAAAARSSQQCSRSLRTCSEVHQTAG